MMKSLRPALAAALLAASAAPGFCQTPGVKAAAREIFEKNKDAVVAVEIIAKSGYAVMGREGRRSERRIELNGTVVDPDGLTVVSDALLGLGSDNDVSFSDEGDQIALENKSSITEAKIIRADGTEVPARLVLRDKDLDLAFLRPLAKPDKAWNSVSLAKSARPEVLDDVVAVGRLNRAADRAGALSLGSVSAVLAKPRDSYAVDVPGRAGCLGCPVFNAAGETLGILLQRKTPDPVQSSSPYGFNYRTSQAESLVLPAEDVLDAAKQAAPNSRPPAP